MTFQSTRPSRGETRGNYTYINDFTISIHSPLAGRDNYDRSEEVTETIFQSTRPSRGETDIDIMKGCKVIGFQSTRPSRGETDDTQCEEEILVISIHSPLAGRDFRAALNLYKNNVFQSTRPSRGETYNALTGLSLTANFNPLAPRGARPLIAASTCGSL